MLQIQLLYADLDTDGYSPRPCCSGLTCGSEPSRSWIFFFSSVPHAPSRYTQLIECCSTSNHGARSEGDDFIKTPSRSQLFTPPMFLLLKIDSFFPPSQRIKDPAAADDELQYTISSTPIKVNGVQIAPEKHRNSSLSAVKYFIEFIDTTGEVFSKLRFATYKQANLWIDQPIHSITNITSTNRCLLRCSPPSL